MPTRSYPLISIITATYNSEKHFPQTLRSIREQNYNRIEYIVIDGCSSDKTLELIKSNLDVITKWVSEPDAGIRGRTHQSSRDPCGSFDP